jgi:hypothetical protein
MSHSSIDAPAAGHHGPASTPSDAQLHVEAARLVEFGAAEAAIAQVSVALDREQRRARHQRREAQAQRHTETLARVRELRKAAKTQMVAGMVACATQLARGLASMFSGAAAGDSGGGKDGGAQAGSSVLDGASQLAATGLSRRAERARVNAEQHGAIAQRHEDEARAHTEDAADVQALRDRARAHLDAVAQAQAQARLASVRG